MLFILFLLVTKRVLLATSVSFVLIQIQSSTIFSPSSNMQNQTNSLGTVFLVTTKHALDLVEDTTRVLLGGVSVLVLDTSGGVFTSSKTGLGIRVSVSTPGGSRVVGEVTASSGNTGVKVLVGVIVTVSA